MTGHKLIPRPQQKGWAGTWAQGTLPTAPKRTLVLSLSNTLLIITLLHPGQRVHQVPCQPLYRTP